MSSILYIKSSLLGGNSTTNALVDAIHHHFKALGAEQHVTRDLLPENTTHLVLGQSQAAIDVQLGELQAADVLVLGAPMYNFGVSSMLKAWIDHVVQAGRTFHYTATGPEGLLKNKKAILVLATGGVYSAGPAAGMDFVEPYLRAVLGFIGITDVTVIRAEALAMGEAGVQSKEKALAAVRALTL